MKPTQSGKIKGTNHITIEGDIDKLKKGSGVDGYEFGADLATEGVKIQDPGYGQTVTIRTFEFKMNPEIKPFPTDTQQLFNAHARQISTLLWADGLVPFEEVSPKVIINKRKKTYTIFVVAKPNASNMFIEKARNLSEHLQHGRTRH